MIPRFIPNYLNLNNSRIVYTNWNSSTYYCPVMH